MSLQERIEEKRRELESLSQVEVLAENLCSQLEKLEARLDTLADATEASAMVMSNWNQVIKAASMASMSLAKYTEADYENEENPPIPEMLVRLRLEQ